MNSARSTSGRPVDPRRLVDPELAPALDVLPDMSNLSAQTLGEWRGMFDIPGEEIIDSETVSVERVSIPPLRPGDPPIDALYYRPKDKAGPAPALLNLHGGGYVLGTAERDHPGNAKLAGDLGCHVLSINYRLAPEHPYPAPVEDCYAALAWLHNEAARLGLDAERIGVRGWSAGGGLAASLALMARDRAEFAISYLALLYPMLDDRTKASPATGQFVWTERANAYAWNAYLGALSDGGETDYAVPGRVANLAGMPPTFMAVGSIDLFAGECAAFAAALLEAGVPTELHIYPGAFHGFDLLAEAEVTRKYLCDQNAALLRGLVGS